ncbi:hypothetical protein KAR48_21025 [bacterium]|nr:hypothetical protein [bacterium]
MIVFIKMAALIQIPLAVLGVIGAVTGWQPYIALYQYCPWRQDFELNAPRWGFTRVQGPFSHSIMFGDFFIMFLPLIWILKQQRDYWGKLAYYLSAIAILGAISCFSSGSWVMLGATLCFLYSIKWSHKIKNILVVTSVVALLAEILSNRPLYHVLPQYLNTGGVWWQRARLIDCAIEDFGKWWLAGYGGVDPGWGTNFWMDFTDINNEFILKGVECGVWGIIALCSVIIVAFQELVRSSKKTTNKELRSLHWSLGVILSATLIAWMGVTFFGQLSSIFYLIMGLIGSAVLFPMVNTTARYKVNSNNSYGLT